MKEGTGLAICNAIESILIKENPEGALHVKEFWKAL